MVEKLDTASIVPGGDCLYYNGLYLIARRNDAETFLTDHGYTMTHRVRVNVGNRKYRVFRLYEKTDAPRVAVPERKEGDT